MCNMVRDVVRCRNKTKGQKTQNGVAGRAKQGPYWRLGLRGALGPGVPDLSEPQNQAPLTRMKERNVLIHKHTHLCSQAGDGSACGLCLKALTPGQMGDREKFALDKFWEAKQK